MILVLTTADTEILALRTLVEDLPAGFEQVRAANPTTLAGPVPLEGASVVLVRLLGGHQAWADGFDDLARRCADAAVPLIALGGEATPDADLARRSTVPAGIVTQAFAYLSQGGPANLTALLRFVSDTLLLTGFGFDPPVEVPSTALWRASARHQDRPLVGVVLYRAHVVAGNTTFVDDLCDAVEEAGADVVAVATYSLRPEPDGSVPAVELLTEHGVDVVITTVLAAGSFVADPGGGSEAEVWDAGALARLGVPVLQAPTVSRPEQEWRDSAAGLAPVDVAMGVAIPEFDGRIITVPFTFKEVVDSEEELGAPVHAYRTAPDRAARVAQLAVRTAMLGRIPPAERRVALVLSAYPTKKARLGNAVGLDTPASAVVLLRALAAAGHVVTRIPAHGDALMAELADALTYDAETLTAAQRARALGALGGSEHRDWLDGVPAGAREQLEATWGPAPGTVHLDETGESLLFSGLDLGNVIVAVQPPRGFGDDPVAVYHDPELVPTHHYLAFYRWLDEHWGAHAIVHLGKHGTLEWLPGKSVGLSASCHPDLALGSVPLVYPFVVNDPGEGTQAKRRAHAVIVDHLVPPMTRAGLTDDLARLESLLDEHARCAVLDPAKLPAIRRQVWDCLVDAEIHRDLGWSQSQVEVEGVETEVFDDRLLHVDGHLCELKDAQIRGGLHVLGQPPAGDALVDLVLAVTRVDQGTVPSLRSTVAAELGVDLGAEVADRAGTDAVEDECRRRVEALAVAGWDPGRLGDESLAGDETLRWVANRLVPALGRTTDELDAVLGALAGRPVPSGPSGAPTRGMAHVLPTGRNFYSVDPKAIPSPLAVQVGRTLAQRCIERHRSDTGRAPEVVGIVLWGTAAMRTMGDDVAMALALLGVEPTWHPESGRVTGLRRLDEAELERPRVDVTLRISGFFRDAFPHVVDLLDEAVELAGFAADGDPRLFGPSPGGYGSGILAVLESGNWRDDADLAAVYETWGGFSYGRAGAGVPARAAMRRRFAAIDVAVKNQDNREHDIFDSDDYLQDHGGMVAMVRHLTGASPRAYFGDTADPSRPRVRSLDEEAARVVRSRVLNPKWLQAMVRHGYKGAFEMAATVDYLFGYDATAHVVADWMYERVTAAYVGDPGLRAFFGRSNPWALRQIAERLLEAVERGMWTEPTEEALATLRDAVLEAEGWEERR